MGLFCRRISQRELEYVKMRLTQLQDTIKLVNTTVKPDVFFRRLNFMLDILLDLQKYEKYGVFKGDLPSVKIAEIQANLHLIVNDFITRVSDDCDLKCSKLKTEKGKANKRFTIMNSLISAFDCASTFWAGDRGFPHYCGPLYTEDNYERVKHLFYSLDD